ncbi:ABC transporter substrate-binding protein [Virgibacillus sp. NKC19-3]|uniref:ABC transporter substrate-binding protein n=1 Tax=Virgibacillus saliphilus TaxID=2831674 RepID=UPI001C9AEC4F|nr:ABC transporter substrate-binding protein [Virgibacillus sp. NKC19-3]MBY7141858.1 ABC transporter substrate-binding protein [Virgibacillus sp. NKC19-3]
MKKTSSFLFVFILTFSLLIGCSSDNSNSEDEGQTADDGTEKTEETEDTEGAFPQTVTDALDNEVTMDEKPERIVSVIPSNTEIAFALGLEDEIVGVSDNDNYPEEVQEKESIGGMELNVEVILSLDPDLVLAHESSVEATQEGLEQIRDAGINVFVVNDAQDMEGTYQSIEQIGQVTGSQDEAEEMVSDMEEGFASLHEQAEEIPEEEQKSVFFEVSPEPDLFTAGQNTFFDSLLQVVGADNAAGEQDGWVPIDPETIVELNPDVVITTYGHYSDDPVEQVISRDGWESMTAVENEDVYDIHSDLVSRPGPRLVEGAKEIAEVVYPEYFEAE